MSPSEIVQPRNRGHRLSLAVGASSRWQTVASFAPSVTCKCTNQYLLAVTRSRARIVGKKKEEAKFHRPSIAAVVSFSYVYIYKLLYDIQHIERFFAVKYNMYSLENQAIDRDHVMIISLNIPHL